jgi:hypothetical protein
MRTPYEVNVWGSRPHTHDDCWIGDDFTDVVTAAGVFEAPGDHFNLHEPGELWIELVGFAGLPDADLALAGRELDVRRITADAPVPHWSGRPIWSLSYRYKAADPGYRPEDDTDWKAEMAMQNGMAFGVDGYNDTHGWKVA